MIARLTILYVSVFTAVLAGISAGAYWFVSCEYTNLLAPALKTAEGAAGYNVAMTHVVLTIAGVDVPLIIAVGVLAYLLARSSLKPLLANREREKQFAADAAHELRSPLATIATVAQAARREASGEIHAAFDTIATTALDASGLVGDLLTLSRDPRPGLLEREPLELTHIVEACTREFEPRLPSALSLHAQKSSAIIHGDQRRLRELLRNLLDNALKHARSTITVECGKDSRYGYIRVRDDGPGLPAELRDRIFDRFFSQDGSGLGLAISRWIATAHNGTLTLEEGPQGASFIAKFPTISG